jgi:hypothetical protein
VGYDAVSCHVRPFHINHIEQHDSRASFHKISYLVLLLNLWTKSDFLKSCKSKALHIKGTNIYISLRYWPFSNITERYWLYVSIRYIKIVQGLLCEMLIQNRDIVSFFPLDLICTDNYREFTKQLYTFPNFIVIRITPYCQSNVYICE